MVLSLDEIEVVASLNLRCSSFLLPLASGLTGNAE